LPTCSYPLRKKKNPTISAHRSFMIHYYKKEYNSWSI
jgi:hypothetical protein